MLRTPTEVYQALLSDEEFMSDDMQARAVQMTQALYDNLLELYEDYDGLLSKFKRHIKRDAVIKPVPGLYFWGGVGRGKTMIIDLFFDSLPFPEKKRIHFHRFMQMVHKQLKHMNEIENPLHIVAASIAKDTWVLCFDEFHVADITDAMLLGGLLKALFDRGITLVTTSNDKPDDLYADGLQRDRFLPAIELIKQHTRVFNLDSGIDYRLRILDKAEIYHSPLDKAAEKILSDTFRHIAPDEGVEDDSIEIEGRHIKTIRRADGVVWFDFDQICGGPRGAADYIELAYQYQTILISNIPVMSESENDMAKRFMTLVDEFYDRQVKLIISAAAQPEAIYAGKKLLSTFNRTISRLQEMQTHDYLAKPHIP